MRLGTPLLASAAFALALCAAARAQDERQKDQQVVDDFVVTRGVSLDPPGRQKQKQAKPAPTPARNSSAKNRKPAAGSPSGDATASKSAAGKGGASPKSGGAGAAAVPPDGGAAGDGAKLVPAAARTLSLGYTLFLKDRDGRLAYADPSQEFRTGDRIAIAFESNADGYLYLFNSSGAAKTPDMIFPSASIDDGSNALRTSTYETFPSEADAGFVFTEPAGTERLFVVFSRTPLAGVPTGEALVKFCRGKGEGCVWPVAAAQWSRILVGAKGRTIKTQLAQEGPPPDTLGMIQRGIRVTRSAPKPAFLRVGDTPDADVLVTEIVLTHK